MPHYLHHPESCCVYIVKELIEDDFDDGCVVEVTKEQYEELKIMYATPTELKNTDTIVLTHTDLDGVVSGWLAERVFQAKSVISSNYTEIANKLKHIKDTYGDVCLVITDLHVEPMDLKYALDNFLAVKMFDHHPQTEKYHELPSLDKRFTLTYDNTRSATKLVYDYGVDEKYPWSDLDTQFVNQVNMFDMWNHRDPEFPYARMANDLYWRDKFFSFMGKLRSHGALDIPRGLSKEDLKFCRESFEAIAKVKYEAEWMNTEYGSTIVFLEAHQKSAINLIPQMMGSTSTTGLFYIVYYGADKYTCSVRVDDTDEPEFEMGNLMKKFSNTCEGVSGAGGHDYAGGMAFKPEVNLKGAVQIINELEDMIHEGKPKDFFEPEKVDDFDDDIPF